MEPWSFTLREFLEMEFEYRMETWKHTSKIMATFHNAQGNAVRYWVFHPYGEQLATEYYDALDAEEANETNAEPAGGLISKLDSLGIQ